jgi:hypothetical protein
VDQDRFVYLSFHIDTNRINARTSLPNMNQLERWHRDGVIQMLMSHTAQKEAVAGGSSARAKKAVSYIFTQTMNPIDDERRLMGQIERILFPGGASSASEWNDVEIVFNAWKYSAVLVTADGGSRRQPGGILGNEEFLGRLGIGVMSDDKAVELVRQKISTRDRLMIERCGQEGRPLPAWVGQD